MDYQPVLADMVAVAREAGALTQGYFERFRDIEIGIKGPADFVSDADKNSELLIRKYLFERYPDWSFTGEEFDPVERDSEHRGQYHRAAEHHDAAGDGHGRGRDDTEQAAQPRRTRRQQT